MNIPMVLVLNVLLITLSLSLATPQNKPRFGVARSIATDMLEYHQAVLRYAAANGNPQGAVSRTTLAQGDYLRFGYVGVAAAPWSAWITSEYAVTWSSALPVEPGLVAEALAGLSHQDIGAGLCCNSSGRVIASGLAPANRPPFPLQAVGGTLPPKQFPAVVTRLVP